MRRLLAFLAPWLLALVALGGAQPSSAAPPWHRLADPNVCANTFLKADFAANGGQGTYCLGGQRYGSLLELPGVAFTRASPKTCQTSSGFVVQVASGAPCITDRGLLVEGAATNLLLHSQEFDNAVYDKGTGGSISANAVVAPDGSLTADAYTWPSSIPSYAALSQAVAGNAALANSYAIWLKVPIGSKKLNLKISDVTTTTVVSSSITITTSWQRFAYSTAVSALTNTGIIGVGIGAGGGATIAPGDVIYVWGAQLENNASVSTSDIPTGSAAVTRSADTLILGYSGSPSVATVLYNTNSSASPPSSSPLNLGSSSFGAWVNNHIRAVTVQ